MNINYNLSGPDRKKLVQAIAEILECDAKYLGAPTFAYQVSHFTIDKAGSLFFDDGAVSEDIEQLLEALCEKGFEAEIEAETKPVSKRGIAIQMPLSQFTENQLQNLRNLVEAKASLIKKALGIDELPINIIDERLDFTWFPAESSPEEVKTYMEFVTALCNMACNQKRIQAKEKEVENEKYAFRCFLLRLGFIGEDYKVARKILLQNLTGSSAFKTAKGGTAEEKKYNG